MSSDVPPEAAARPLRIDPGLRLDQDDLRILQILSRQARVTKSTLASEIGLSITPTWERVRKLEAAGLIRGYRAVIDWQRLFKTSQVLVQIVLGQHTAASMRTFAQRMADAPEVAFCYATGGGIDYIAMIECSDIAQYQAFMEQLLREDLGIARYSTYVVTKAIRAPGERPLPALDPPRQG